MIIKGLSISVNVTNIFTTKGLNESHAHVYLYRLNLHALLHF